MKKYCLWKKSWISRYFRSKEIYPLNACFMKKNSHNTLMCSSRKLPKIEKRHSLLYWKSNSTSSLWLRWFFSSEFRSSLLNILQLNFIYIFHFWRWTILHPSCTFGSMLKQYLLHMKTIQGAYGSTDLLLWQMKEM